MAYRDGPFAHLVKGGKTSTYQVTLDRAANEMITHLTWLDDEAAGYVAGLPKGKWNEATAALGEFMVGKPAFRKVELFAAQK